MKCPNCKQEIDNNSAFCEYCGTRIKKNKKGLWITLGIVAVAIVIGTIAIVSFKQQSDDYVDLGLPSGTLWKKVNEGADRTNFGQTNDTYDEAISKFANNLPTKEQFEELINNCKWYWEGNGYKLVGPNGNSIYLPAAGFLDCDGNMRDACGVYWSSTPYDSDDAWFLYFYSSEVHVGLDSRCGGRSVRLVQNL